MSHEERFSNELDNFSASNAARTDATLPGPKRPVAVVAFEIDENDDPGGDPYNHTGSFCVPDFADD